MKTITAIVDKNLFHSVLYIRVLEIGTTALASGLLALSAIGQHANPSWEARLHHDTTAVRFVDEHGVEAAAISSGLDASGVAMQRASILISRSRSNI